jgi:hypothetical protein
MKALNLRTVKITFDEAAAAAAAGVDLDPEVDLAPAKVE